MSEQFTIGSYVFVRYLGKGGMAAVWEARHSHLDLGRLAIKFLLEEYAANQELQERFLAEARIQSKLHHPSIVKVRDFFQVDGRSYMVMEYVAPPGREGGEDDAGAMPLNLEARLQESPELNLDQIYTFSTDVLSALHYSHEHILSVVHRDVKPSNIMLSRSGHAVLTDFGIAKLLNESGSGSLTRSTIGTPDYMSPEQITSQSPVDRRSDVYGFGCVLYAILSGDPPFAGNASTDFNIKYSHVHQAPPPLKERHGIVSKALCGVVMRCLEKDPGKRFQTCSEVSTALTLAIYPSVPSAAEIASEPQKIVTRPVAAHVDTPAPPAVVKKLDPVQTQEPPPNRRVIFNLVAAILLLVLLVGGYFAWHSSSTTSVQDKQIPDSVKTPVLGSSSYATPPTQTTSGPSSKSSSRPDPSKSRSFMAPQPTPHTPEREDSDCCVNTPECRLARKKAGLQACGFINNNK